ncbi:MAG: hypothetical protein AVDCRST_MAG37-2941 [uncultured Rubrobacteraceae bacterium]|uniref:Uncharacterized protein n=1 Tax=uncultured Rubrobacteraceae bacterium TaxID=349277 RepID=A0A6J4QWP3_9ACTN|nr:MAG: hypothetical protein AVDCRST_MAG37-2941 [uncultured Rubrobacteraceae bacterium]
MDLLGFLLPQDSCISRLTIRPAWIGPDRWVAHPREDIEGVLALEIRTASKTIPEGDQGALLVLE